MGATIEATGVTKRSGKADRPRRPGPRGRARARVDAARSLTLGPEAASAVGQPASFFVIRALARAAAFVLVFAPLTALFKRA